MKTEIQKQRDETKARHELYRSVARKHGTVRDHVAVCECEGGAFVEIVVWIPKEEISVGEGEPPR